MKTTRAVLLLMGALALLALPAAAEYYTIRLSNGNELDTLYRPRLAAEGGDKVLVATETGNWISLPIAAIESVVSHIEARGFGKVINTTTILIGNAPNDAEVPGEQEALDPATRLLNYLENQQQPQPSAPFTVQQFAEPNSVGGIPLGFTNPTTPPLSGGAGTATIEPPVAGDVN